jgi:tight adherence protein B
MKVFLGTLFLMFIFSVFAIELLFYANRRMRHANPTKLRKRVRGISTGGETAVEDLDILQKKRKLSGVPLLNSIFWRIPGVGALDRLTEQANVKYPLSVFVLLAVLFALTGHFAVSHFMRNPAASAVAAILLGSVPLFYLRIKKKNRMRKFLVQLPEGLELIARGLRAGHAFTTGMKLAADNFDDPLGTEFNETLDEINFGLSVPDALKNLAHRVDCPDLSFFVVSVVIQRETGGNLAEIIESIARIIRERFQFEDKLRVLSGEARFSAKILVAIPLFVLVALRFLNPDYGNVMYEESLGRMMLGGAAAMMVFGIFVMMRMVKIEV